MNSLQIHSYGDTPIIFNEINGCIYADATAMSKSFNKRPDTWLKTQKAKDYINKRSSALKSEVKLIVVNNGGANQGTWIHEKLVLRFAQWLSVDFEIWVDDLLEKIYSGELKFVGGKPKESPEVSWEEVDRLKRESELSTKMAQSMEKLLEVYETHKEIEKDYYSGSSVINLKDTKEEVEKKAEELDEVKEEPVLRVSSRDSTLSMDELSAKLNLSDFGRNKMMKFLRDHKVLKKSNKPYQAYISNGWFSVATSRWTRPTGEEVVDLVSRFNPDKISNLKRWILKKQKS